MSIFRITKQHLRMILFLWLWLAGAALSNTACQNNVSPKEGESAQEKASSVETTPKEAVSDVEDAAESTKEAELEQKTDASVERAPEAVLETASEGKASLLETLPQEIAKSVCGALFRCCKDDNITQYFAQYRANRALEPYHKRLPPDATLTEESCTSVLSEMIVVIPFGDWIHAAKTGKVQFNQAAAQSCLQELQQASCGDAVAKALFDTTCFAFSPPPGGPLQRKAFTRIAKEGQSCTIIRDGVGAGFFGTCEPTTSFCCYPAAQAGTCGYPKEGVTGICKKASKVDEACTVAPTVQLCQTGLDCNDEKGKCEAPITNPLALGDECVTERFQPLGECKDSFCDLTGTRKCTELRMDGETCNFSTECKSGGCENKRCGPSTYCVSR